jgi:glycosyltransferase involved in cell wall biosynthesis
MHLGKMYRRTRPDLTLAVWAHTYGLLATAARIHPLLFVPLASDIILDPQRNPIYRFSAGFVAKRSDRILCDSDWVASQLVSLFPDAEAKVVVKSKGVDSGTFFPGPKQNGQTANPASRLKQLVLLSTRWFEPVYDVFTLVAACKALSDEGLRFTVRLVGDGPEKSRLQDFVSCSGLSKVVHFVGKKPHWEMSTVYRSADIYVTTSLSDGTAMSLHEAMATGLAIVASNTPGNREWITDGSNGLLFKAGDSAELARCLRILILDARLRSALGREARLTIMSHGSRRQYAETVDRICRTLVIEEEE